MRHRKFGQNKVLVMIFEISKNQFVRLIQNVEKNLELLRNFRSAFSNNRISKTVKEEGKKGDNIGFFEREAIRF